MPGVPQDTSGGNHVIGTVDELKAIPEKESVSSIWITPYGDEREFDWISDSDVAAVIENFPKLNRLMVSDSRITARSLKAICQKYDLEYLSLDDSAIKGEEFKYLRNQLNLRHFRVMEPGRF